jgi:hypothetical protein
MKLCSYLHEEIVFDEPHCPMCSMRDEYEDRIQVIEHKHSDDMSYLQDTCDEYLAIIKDHLPEFLI